MSFEMLKHAENGRTVRVRTGPLSREKLNQLRSVADVHELVMTRDAVELEIDAADLEQLRRYHDEVEVPDRVQLPASLVCYYDYSSPFSYLSLSWLPELRERYNLEVVWRPFELRPPWSPIPAWWYDTAMSQLRWEERREYVTAAGLPMAAQRPTFRALSRPLMAAGEFARESGRFEAFFSAYARSYYAEAADLRQWSVVQEIAVTVGLDAEHMTAAVVDRRYEPRIDAWRHEAEALGVFGVPTFLVGDEVIWGRKPIDAIEGALQRCGYHPQST